MAIDHESPFKELRVKNRRIMGGGGPEPEEEEEEEEEQWPQWLQPLLSARFFAQCKAHADSHRSECNMFCLDCAGGAFCSLCLAHHRDHHAIQIRRSSYHDVIRVSDIHKFLDIGGVQTYVINSSRVVFLNERPQHKPSRGAANTCEVCRRSLLDNFRFCSLGCKVVGCSTVGKKVRRKRLLAMESDSEAEAEASSSSRNAAGSEKSCFTPSTPPPAAAQQVKRRKGIPHRAPFGSLIVEY